MKVRAVSSIGLAVFLVTLALATGFVPASAGLVEEPLLNEEPAPRPEAVSLARDILGSRYQTELPRTKEVRIVELPVTVLPDILVKIVLVLAIVLILTFVFNLFYSGGRLDQNEDDEGGNAAGDIDFSRLRVPDPDKLAAAGRFAEAIHALLLRSLVLISRRLDSSWPRSLTSREILRHGKLPAAARADLGQLIQRVEVHHFGGLEPVAADFSRCREIYARLAGDQAGGRK